MSILCVKPFDFSHYSFESSEYKLNEGRRIVLNQRNIFGDKFKEFTEHLAIECCVLICFVRALLCIQNPTPKVKKELTYT